MSMTHKDICKYWHNSYIGKYNFNILHMAVLDNDIVSTISLISLMSDINKLTKDYNLTPLMIACLMGHEDIVTYLINKGADINISSNLILDPKENDVVKLSDILKSIRSTEDSVKYIKIKNNGMKAIHYAAFKCNVNIMKMLIDNNCDINDKDSLGNTPSHIAAMNNISTLNNISTFSPRFDSLNKRNNLPINYIHNLPINYIHN